MEILFNVRKLVFMCILDNLNVSNVFVSKFVYIMGDGLILCINVVLSIVLVVVSIVN